MPVRVVLAEDSYLIREGIRGLLQSRGEVEIVAVCGDLPSVVDAVDTLHPDVVVTDIRMPPTQTDEGIQLADDLRGREPAIGVVALSQFSGPELALGLLKDGSDGRAYLLKERVHDIDQLVAAIETVAAGGSMIDSRIVEELVTAQTARAGSPLDDLTPRELEVLAEMARGKSNRAIAESLYLAEGSVEKYVTTVFSKLGVAYEPNIHRRVRAVLLYLAEQPASRQPERAP
jgi:DNA-binding NarL/FixJ family response regulator